MPKFSTFKYGDGTYYGTTAPTTTLSWTFIVAWDGYWSSGNESLRMSDLTVRRGREHLIDPRGEGFEYPEIGEAIGIFDNEDGRYDPFNTDSPLYPNVLPGKFVRIACLDTSTNTNYGVMRGIITDIQPLVKDGKRLAMIKVKDGLRWLNEHTVYVGLKEGQDRDACISDILTGADWPTTEWPLDLSDSLDDLDYWWAWKENALTAIREITDAEIGIFFHDRDGKAVFRGRDYTHNRTLAVDQAEILTDIVFPQPWDVIRNNIDIFATPKLLDEDIEIGTGLFRLRDTPAIAIHEYLTLDCVFNNIALAPGSGSQPRGTLKSACGKDTVTSFAVNSAVGGGGNDLSDWCILTEGEVGDGVQVTIYNNSAQDGYVTFLRVNGDAVYPTDISTQRANNQASQDIYGVKPLTINSFWQESNDDAKAIAAYLLAELQGRQVLPTIRVENRPAIQFYLDLYDRVELTISEHTIDANYRVGAIRHKWLTENGNSVQTTFVLEPYLTPYS